MDKCEVKLKVNGEEQEVVVPARRLLSELLRDDLNLTGTKRGCETGTCGACSVIVDGEVVKSCLSLAVQSDGCRITPVEGLASGDALHRKQAWFDRPIDQSAQFTARNLVGDESDLEQVHGR